MDLWILDLWIFGQFVRPKTPIFMQKSIALFHSAASACPSLMPGVQGSNKCTPCLCTVCIHCVLFFPPLAAPFVASTCRKFPFKKMFFLVQTEASWTCQAEFELAPTQIFACISPSLSEGWWGGGGGEFAGIPPEILPPTYWLFDHS